MDCTQCPTKGCRSFQPCADRRDVYINEYDREEIREYTQSASFLIDNGRAGTLNRLEEIIEYAKNRGYHKIGVAYCYGMEKLASVLRQRLIDEGFRPSMVSCTVDGVSETVLDQAKTKEVVSCNPIGQAHALNREKVELVLLMGLCLGHDLLFQKHIEADVTTFVVKDRVYGHNPILALYDGKTEADRFLEELPLEAFTLSGEDFLKRLKEPRNALFLDLRRDANGKAEVPHAKRCLLRELPSNYRQLLPNRRQEIVLFSDSPAETHYAVMFLQLKGYGKATGLDVPFSSLSKKILF